MTTWKFAWTSRLQFWCTFCSGVDWTCTLLHSDDDGCNVLCSTLINILLLMYMYSINFKVALCKLRNLEIYWWNIDFLVFITIGDLPGDAPTFQVIYLLTIYIYYNYSSQTILSCSYLAVKFPTRQNLVFQLDQYWHLLHMYLPTVFVFCYQYFAIGSFHKYCMHVYIIYHVELYWYVASPFVTKYSIFAQNVMVVLYSWA